MNLKSYQHAWKVLGAATCSSLATYYTMKTLDQRFPLESTKPNTQGISTDNSDGDLSSIGSWVADWDNRGQQAFIKKTSKQHAGEEEYSKPNAIRHIVLVRHGEYTDLPDGSHHLTQRGRSQAAQTGQRLQALGVTWDHVVTSTMSRAQETAMIILKQINFDPLKMKRCALLSEGTPYMADPPRSHKKSDMLRSIERDGPRVEAAFRRYFFRASPNQLQDSYLLIIGHSNVMRYLICRALQFPPEAWARINLNHGSITWLTILPSGHVTINCMGDSGFMPVDQLTSRRPAANASKSSTAVTKLARC